MVWLAGQKERASFKSITSRFSVEQGTKLIYFNCGLKLCKLLNNDDLPTSGPGSLTIVLKVMTKKVNKL